MRLASWKLEALPTTISPFIHSSLLHPPAPPRLPSQIQFVYGVGIYCSVLICTSFHCIGFMPAVCCHYHGTNFSVTRHTYTCAHSHGFSVTRHTYTCAHSHGFSVITSYVHMCTCTWLSRRQLRGSIHFQIYTASERQMFCDVFDMHQ